MEKIKRQITWIAFLFPTLFYAQGIQIGLKGGANFSNFTGGNIENIDFKHATNFHAGLVFEFNLTPSFSIQPEIMYITQGAIWMVLVIKLKTDLAILQFLFWPNFT